MGNMFNKIQSMPKALQIVLAVVLVLLLGFAFVWFGYGKQIKASAEPVEEKNVLIEFPEGTEQQGEMSKLEEIKRSLSSSNQSVNDYWGSLEADKEKTNGGLLAGDDTGQQELSGLDPAVYSQYEMYQIRQGLKTKAEIDADHEEDRLAAERRKRELDERTGSRSEGIMDSDSAYFARLERTYQLMNKYVVPAASQPEQQPAADAPVAEEAGEPEPRKLDIQKQTLPSHTIVSDDIISSLESDVLVGGTNEYNGEIVTVPAKATFLKSEVLVSGQRVIMRLMQDLKLSDGTLIPANTHVSGTCNIGSRLKIKITSINYNGRIYYTDIDIYDNDGTEGIYCPIIVDKQSKRAAKRAAGQTAQSAGNVVANVLRSTPYTSIFGQAASSGISEVSRMIDSEGNVSVKVASGYEFFVFENIEKNQ